MFSPVSDTTTPLPPSIPTTNAAGDQHRALSPINQIGVLNVEGLKTQSSSAVPFVKDTLYEHNMLFIALTETWLRDHLDAEVKIEGYSIFRADRSRPKAGKGRESGGVALYVKEELASSSKPLLIFSNSVIEVLCVHIKQVNQIIVVVYRSPNSSSSNYQSSTGELEEALGEVSNILEGLPAPTPKILVVGDFNLPRTSWPHCVAKNEATPSDRLMTDMISDFMSCYFLTQLVTLPTHKAGNTLDLIFSNDPLAILNIEVFPVAPVSSHYLVEAATQIACPQDEAHIDSTPPSTFDQANLFAEATNWAGMSQELLAHDWVELFQGLNVDDMVQVLINKCEEAVKRFSTIKKKKKKDQRYRPPRDRRILMRKRTKIRKQLKVSSQPAKRNSLMHKLLDIETKLQESYSSQQSNEEEKAVAAIKLNPKYFYAYARHHQKSKTPIGPLKSPTLSGNITNDPKEMAKILACQYNSVFSVPATNIPPQTQATEETLDDIIFTEEHIIKAINEINSQSAPGPDRFPAHLLKNCCKSLAKPLCIIWQTSFASGKVPKTLSGKTYFQER